MKTYLSPIRIPAKKKGNWRIEHEWVMAGDSIPVINTRTALFTGKQPLAIQYDVPMKYHYLKYKGMTVMSDHPQEQFDHEEAVEKMKGRVLIGGLGLGYISRMLDKKPEITEIVVVEKTKTVIDLVWRHLGLRKATIIQEDLYKYLARIRNQERFDYVYLDIWSDESEGTLYDTVLPLRRLSQPLVKSETRIICWKEEVMRSQVKWSLDNKVRIQYKEIMAMRQERFKDEFYGPGKMKFAFWNYMRINQVSQAGAAARVNEYVYNLGTEQWTRKWGKYREQMI